MNITADDIIKFALSVMGENEVAQIKQAITTGITTPDKFVCDALLARAKFINSQTKARTTGKTKTGNDVKLGSTLLGSANDKIDKFVKATIAYNEKQTDKNKMFYISTSFIQGGVRYEHDNKELSAGTGARRDRIIEYLSKEENKQMIEKHHKALGLNKGHNKRASNSIKFSKNPIH